MPYDPDAPMTKEEQMLLDIVCALASNPNISSGDQSVVSQALAIRAKMIEEL